MRSAPGDAALAWRHVGVRTPALRARLARLGVAPELAGTVAPNLRLWGTNLERGLITPDAFAAMMHTLERAPTRTAKPNGRRAAAEQLDLFAARPSAPVVGAPSFASDRLVRAAALRPPLPPQFPPGAPLIVSYGGGVDSTGVLVELVRLGIRPDLILFADTGGEHPETYLYLDVMDDYLARHGFPRITRVRNVPKKAEYDSLESNCIAKAMLPSIAYGAHKHSCSLKWKIAPMDGWVRKHFEPVAAAVRAKRRVDAVRVIGYDAGPADMRRQQRLEAETHDRNVRWHYWYPLQEWGWDRERTLQQILKAGLPAPPKSSCFFCPSQKPWELIELAIRSPDLARRVILMERAAGPNLDTLDGLWRAPVRGDGDSVARPGSMTEFLLEWMYDGRAYAALPSLSAPGVAPSELIGSAVVGNVYRRRLPVSGQDPSLDPSGLADLARRGRAASEALRAWYAHSFGPYRPAESIANLASAVTSAIQRLHTAERAVARRPENEEARRRLREAKTRYNDTLDRYVASRGAYGATPQAIERSSRMFARMHGKTALRIDARAAASARKRVAAGVKGAREELAAIEREYAAHREEYGQLLTLQGSTPKAVSKVLSAFDKQFATGAKAADEDADEGDADED